MRSERSFLPVPRATREGGRLTGPVIVQNQPDRQATVLAGLDLDVLVALSGLTGQQLVGERVDLDGEEGHWL